MLGRLGSVGFKKDTGEVQDSLGSYKPFAPALSQLSITQCFMFQAAARSLRHSLLLFLQHTCTGSSES